MSVRIDPRASVDSRFLDIPYELGRSDFGAADCMGIVVLYLREHGFHYEYSNEMANTYKHWWEHTPRRFMDYIVRQGDMVRFSEVAKFDVLFFLESGGIGSFPSHPGVMVDDRHLLTSYDRIKSQVLMLDISWKSRFWGAVRPRKEGS